MKNGSLITIKGPKGELVWTLVPEIDIDVSGDMLAVKLVKSTKKAAALWGLTRAHLHNMVEGVTKGFEKKLEIEGIGYRASMDGFNLSLTLGFSHPVHFEAPSGIQFKVEKNVITVSGIDKVLVGRVAAQIRTLKPPEPYKGKGIRYQGEIIRRKQGKRAVAAAA